MITTNARRLINDALVEGRIEAAVARLKRETSIADLDEVLAALLSLWEEVPEIVHAFHNSASDACPMECSEAEDYETRFKGFVIEKYHN